MYKVYTLDIHTLINHIGKLPSAWLLTKSIQDNNEKFIIWDDFKNGKVVKCKNKPDDYIFCGIKWIEVEPYFDINIDVDNELLNINDDIIATKKDKTLLLFCVIMFIVYMIGVFYYATMAL